MRLKPHLLYQDNPHICLTDLLICVMCICLADSEVLFATGVLEETSALGGPVVIIFE